MGSHWWTGKDVECRVCGNWFTVNIDEHEYNAWWRKNHCPEIKYRDRYPERDICIDCAMEDTEKEVFK